MEISITDNQPNVGMAYTTAGECIVGARVEFLPVLYTVAGGTQLCGKIACFLFPQTELWPSAVMYDFPDEPYSALTHGGTGFVCNGCALVLPPVHNSRPMHILCVSTNNLEGVTRAENQPADPFQTTTTDEVCENHSIRISPKPLK